MAEKREIELFTEDEEAVVGNMLRKVRSIEAWKWNWTPHPIAVVFSLFGIWQFLEFTDSAMILKVTKSLYGPLVVLVALVVLSYIISSFLYLCFFRRWRNRELIVLHHLQQDTLEAATAIAKLKAFIGTNEEFEKFFAKLPGTNPKRLIEKLTARYS